MMEMLVVLAIIALAAGVSSQLLRPTSPKLRVEASARALCAASRAAHARALATNAETALFVDVARKSFRSTVTGETTIPAEARINLSVAGNMRRGREGAILFFPGGSSTGGDISIDMDANHAHVGVNWLTGATTCDLG